jgi:hypothetical protein
VKTISVAAILLFTNLAFAQKDYEPYIHYFAIWGTLPNSEYKTGFLIGFTNGYFLARPTASTLAECVSHIPYAQAVAMIDKYYNANPEKWHNAAGSEIIAALTVTGGPCGGQ